MNRSRIFKLTAVASLVMASYGANANLYNVVQVTVPANLGAESYASAIDENGNVAGDTRDGTDGIPYRDEAPFGVDNTFTYQNWTDLESYCYRELGYNSCENWAEREWHGINNKGGLEREREAFYQSNYQANAKGFSTVYTSNTDAAATATTSGTSTQLFTTEPSSTYQPGGGTWVANSNNVVVNKFSVDGDVMGTTSSGYYDFGNYGLAFRERGFVGDSILLPAETNNGKPVSDIVTKMGRTMAFDSFTYDSKTYVVGSASVTPFDYNDGGKDFDGRDVGRCMPGGTAIDDPGAESYCQNFAFSTKGFVWDVSTPDKGVAVSSWVNMTAAEEDSGIRDAKSYMSSVRGAVVPDNTLIANEDGTDPEETKYNGKPVLVGYNTDRDDNNLMMQAAIFVPDEDSGDFDITQSEAWKTVFINGAKVKSGSDFIYSNTKATDINNNLLVIGESKRSGYIPENGAAANRMFIADASQDTPTATYFADTGESIFFRGSGGEAQAVNNYNEIVGTIDAETAREYGGKQRRHRGFINPYDFNGTHDARRKLFENRAWWLDDLTNDEVVDGTNNHYRIIAASDINDKGEISATALYCAGGYDNTGHNAYCGEGKGVETIVAVKLEPTVDLNDDTATATITPRSVAEEQISRQGGSLGPWMIGLLGLLSLRRRVKK
ncbi:DUF3466 family protein [Vibrio sp. B1Z05]|uniref:DUF3466 family protein n=1 Tax=Vibrio sp. B1Z05 TaxID=2654980 RepID=UPI00128C7714|nr:DUF3466 family protein [Vibrio sp. B1Z05]MPW35746.1 DUF3466 family protein [Vibrio sp. B1Z05]